MRNLFNGLLTEIRETTKIMHKEGRPWTPRLVYYAIRLKFSRELMTDRIISITQYAQDELCRDTDMIVISGLDYQRYGLLFNGYKLKKDKFTYKDMKEFKKECPRIYRFKRKVQEAILGD
jgi:hypothetical protein